MRCYYDIFRILVYGVVMDFLLTLEKSMGIEPNILHKFCISLFVVCTVATILKVIFFASKKFIDRELNILYSKKYNCFDKLVVIISSTLLAMLLTGLCTFELGTILRTYLFNLDAYYEKLMVTYTTVLTLTYALTMPKHSKLRLFKLSDESAKKFCHVSSRIVFISFCLVSIGLISTNVATTPKTTRMLEYALSIVLGGYYFAELFVNRKAISNSFTITKSSEYSIAAKLTSFISNKFVFIAVVGMFGVLISDYNLSQTDIHFYENLFNVYQLVLMLYILQLGLSTTINKFIERIENLEKNEVHRKKNLVWICDVTVMMTYFCVACYVLKLIGMDAVQYMFHSKIIGSVLTIFITLVIHRAFREFIEAYKSSSYKGFLSLASIVFNFILFAVSGLIILESWGIQTMPLLASFTAINVAVGFAAQECIKSFLQGIMLLVEKDLLIGDFVTINDMTGTVEKLSVRVLNLRCIDGSIKIIPYSHVNSFTNFSRGYHVARDVLRICDPKDINEAIQLLKETCSQILTQAKYKNKIYGEIDIDGIEPYNGNGIEIKWSLMTANSAVSLYFKDELYMEMSQLLRSKNIQIPVGRIYERLTS